MSRIAAFFTFIRSLFPFTHEGRQTLVYVAIAWAAPVICAMLLWAMSRIEVFPGAPASERLARFADLADRISWGLLIILIAYACFVSIRAVKISKDGFSAESRDNAEPIRDGDSVTVTKQEPDA